MRIFRAHGLTARRTGGMSSYKVCSAKYAVLFLPFFTGIGYVLVSGRPGTVFGAVDTGASVSGDGTLPQSRHLLVPEEYKSLYQHPVELIQAFALHPRHFTLGLYSAKTSGTTAKKAYRRMGGADDNDNFINNPLHPGSTMFHQPQKFWLRTTLAPKTRCPN